MDVLVIAFVAVAAVGFAAEAFSMFSHGRNRGRVSRDKHADIGQILSPLSETPGSMHRSNIATIADTNQRRNP